ncbi:aldose 1-epimerase family protein [Planctomonas psychrotolerans]|uniref:aldose 1-epimerase family protein n=1 Tax=Planctomonas psychrotolerans TaxID=2528712 RepID=UPI001239F0C4|nr:aldose 1-epimerase family protein [Planctomonas psychrotolerans]
MRAVSGNQFTLRRDTPAGEVRATVTALAAALRRLSVNGIDLVEPYGEDRIAPMGAGLVLVPWPNRIRDGVWLLDGEEQQLDITEPGYGNASHGLLRNTGYAEVERAADTVVLAATVFPQHGYPFLLDTRIRYRLTDDGLMVTHTVRNDSGRAAPVAVGAHPYVKIGDVPTAELVLRVPADTFFETDSQLIPVAEHRVDGTPFDLRGGRRVAELNMNSGFGAVQKADGTSRSSLTAPDGRGVELWADHNFGYLQVYTPNIFPTAAGPNLAVAIEPMTAPANAFNSGQGLRWLEPDQEWSLSWGIRFTGFPDVADARDAADATDAGGSAGH